MTTQSDLPNLIAKFRQDSDTASKPDRVAEEMESHVENILEEIQQAHSVEGKLEQLEEKMVEIDESVEQELEDVLKKLSEFGPDIDVYVRFIVKYYQDSGGEFHIQDMVSAFEREVYKDDGDIDLVGDHTPQEVREVMRNIHKELADVYSKLEEKNELIKEIEEEAKQVDDWDTNIGEELNFIEDIVGDVDEMVEIFAKTDSKVDSL